MTARYVEIVPTDNYYGSGLAPGGDRVGFGDVAFEKITPVTGRKLIFPNTVDFGTTDKSKTVPLVLKNYGTEAVAISSITLEGTDAAAFNVKSAPTTLPPISQSVVEVEFKSAAATLGPLEAFLRVSSNDTANPSAVILISGEYVSFPDEFYPITSVTSDTAGTDYYQAGGLIQGIGVGFSDTQPHPQITGAATWVTNAPNGSVNYFNPAPEPTPLLLFELGEDLPLSEISLWGYASSNSNGVRDFSLTFATAAEGPYGNSSIAYEPTFTVELGNVDRNSFHFDRVVTAAYVMLTPINNWGADSGIPGGDRVGIGEVAFQKGAAIAPTAGGFAISSVSRNPLGQVTLSFGAEEGSSYTVYRSTTLSNWSPVSAALAGVNGVMEYTDTSAIPVGATAVFYRVSRTTPQ